MTAAKQCKSVRYRRVLQIFALLLAVGLLLPLAPYALAIKDSPIVVPNPGADLWRAVRGAGQGDTQVRGVEAGVLISDAGQDWRKFRVESLVPATGYGLAVILGLLLLYFLIRGRIRIKEGRSHSVLLRTTAVERWIHWITAVIFIILALTGLVLLYGRWVLIPVLGREGFGVTAAVCKNAHNFIGPLFVVVIPALFFAFLRDSLFKLKADMMWFLKAGGYLGGSHPKSWKFNAGQKAWFWVAVLGGVALCVTGLMLDFPLFDQTRSTMQNAQIIHTIAAAVVIGFFFVHVYLGALGVEGAFEGVVSGYVDANWAKEHHQLWYERCEREGAVMDAPRRGDAAPKHEPAQQAS